MQEVSSEPTLALQEWNEEIMRLCAGDAGHVSDPSGLGH